MISAIESPVFVVGEDSILTAAEIAADAGSDGTIATAVSINLYRRDTKGTGQTLLAMLDGNSAGATAWTKFLPKPLAVVRNAFLAAGEMVTVLPTLTITSFNAKLTLHFQKVKPS